MIKIKREGPKRPPPDFEQKLRDYNRTYGSPEVAVFWNGTNTILRRDSDGFPIEWDPRWEIWVEVTDNTKQTKTIESEGDVEFEGKTWRLLNTWQYPDKSFAPLDDRVFQSLREVDTWTHAETYHELVEKPERYKKEQEFKALKDTAYGMRTNLSRR